MWCFQRTPVALLSRGEATPVPYLLGINSLELEWNLPFVSGWERFSPQRVSRGCLLGSVWAPSQSLVAPLRIHNYLGIPCVPCAGRAGQEDGRGGEQCRPSLSLLGLHTTGASFTPGSGQMPAPPNRPSQPSFSPGLGGHDRQKHDRL